MNYHLLKNNIDIYSMQSATKTGALNYNKYANKKLETDDSNEVLKRMAKEGFEFYNEKGRFNNDMFEYVATQDDSIQFLDWNYLKEPAVLERLQKN